MNSYLEFSLVADTELAEAISEAIYPYVEGGTVLEQTGDFPMESEWRADGDGALIDDEGRARAMPDLPVTVRAYIPDDDTTEARKLAIERALAYLGMIRAVPAATWREVKHDDWAESWKASFKPLRIGRRILIRPTWVEARELLTKPDDIVLALDPGLAFGTGLHPTTQLCALALEERVRPGMNVLDVGCGSGVLSILAAKLLAAEVMCVDTDPEAVRATRQNAEVNAVEDRLRVAAGSWDAPLVGAHYEIVVANILAPVIVKLLAAGLGAKGDAFVFSGILDTQAESVVEAIKSARLEFVERKQMNDWVCLIARAVTGDS